MTYPRTWVHIGTIFRNGLLICFVLVGPSFSNLTKSFVLSAHFVEERMQNIRTDSFRVFVMSDDFARNHSDLNRMFLPVTYRGGPKSLPESLDNPALFHGGIHSGF